MKTNVRSESGSRSDLERSYSGYLRISPLDRDALKHVRAMVRDLPAFEVTPEAIEIEYQGRDTSRVIVKTLLSLARVLGEAEGEVQCQISGDANELRFEFFQIRDGKLVRQRGNIVREPEEDLTDSSL